MNQFEEFMLINFQMLRHNGQHIMLNIIPRLKLYHQQQGVQQLLLVELITPNNGLSI
jgi:hypothetical protein